MAHSADDSGQQIQCFVMWVVTSWWTGLSWQSMPAYFYENLIFLKQNETTLFDQFS